MLREQHRIDRYVELAAVDMQLARDDLLTTLEAVGADDWGRSVPYASRTLHDLLAHLAAADHTWALAAQGLLRGEGAEAPASSPAEAAPRRDDPTARGRRKSPDALIAEMEQRRRLLMSLYELLEPRHLALALPAFGDEHNSVRERIWVGYHDRMHADDLRRALAMRWHPPRLEFLPLLLPAVESLSTSGVLYMIYNVDPVNWEKPSVLPGWTNRQVMAHIATGDWVFQAHLRHVIEHGDVGEWPDVAAGNERLLAERAQSTVHSLIDELLSMRHETLLLLAQVRPEHLALPIRLAWMPEPDSRTMLDYVVRFHFHERTHAEHLRPAMKYAR